MDVCGRNPMEMERRFLELLDESGVDRPDRVEHYPSDGEIIFFWEQEKVAVILDLKQGRVEPPV
jgi:hypothetical protein